MLDVGCRIRQPLKIKKKELNMNKFYNLKTSEMNAMILLGNITIVRELLESMPRFIWIPEELEYKFNNEDKSIKIEVEYKLGYTFNEDDNNEIFLGSGFSEKTNELIYKTIADAGKKSEYGNIVNILNHFEFYQNTLQKFRFLDKIKVKRENLEVALTKEEIDVINQQFIKECVEGGYINKKIHSVDIIDEFWKKHTHSAV